jgi:hypothetical protein
LFKAKLATLLRGIPHPGNQQGQTRAITTANAGQIDDAPGTAIQLQLFTHDTNRAQTHFTLNLKHIILQGNG